MKIILYRFMKLYIKVSRVTEVLREQLSRKI